MRPTAGIPLAIALIVGTIVSIAAKSQPIPMEPAAVTVIEASPSAPAELVPSDSDFRVVVGDQSAGP